MNITEETNDYFSTTENFAAYMERQLTGSWNDQQVWNNLKDKLKTTPDPGINRISKVFRVDWSKVFKRGWLLWK